MDFRRLLGAVLAVLFHPGCAFKLSGQRICRRGTERPCYQVLSHLDRRQRVSFAEARQACRSEGGGELLSVRTESEQRLVESFLQIQPGGGAFWIGMRRGGAQHQGCPAQYHWLDGSQDAFRNWQEGEPSCEGAERCVVLRRRPSLPTHEERPLLFTWSDEDCNNKNNFVCKYSEEKVLAFTVAGNTIHTAAPNLSLRPNLRLVTEGDETPNIHVSESSVPLAEGRLFVSYILFGTIPLLLLLLGATGVFCFRRAAQRRKTESHAYPSSRPDPWLSAGPGSCPPQGPYAPIQGPYAPIQGPYPPTQGPYPPIQGPYACSDVTKLPLSALGVGGGGGARAKPESFCPSPSAGPQSEDYENLPSQGTASGFVTNDIYETCRGRGQTGWVDNEIYG